MIFFSVWLRVYSREVLRELFQLPNNVYYNRNFRNFSCRLSRSGWASVLDLFQRTFQPSRAKHRNSSHPNAPQRSRAGLWACRPLPTRKANATSRQAQNSSPPNQPHIPRFRPDLCPPSSDRARPEAPHNPTRPPLQA